MVWGLGAPKLKPVQELYEELEGIKAKLIQLKHDGFIIMQMDEAVFSPKSYND